MNIHETLHQRAMECAKRYLQLETELIEILQSIDEQKTFRVLGFSSLFQYCLKALGLSENQSYAFIQVSRKAREVPALKAAINMGTLSVNQAKKITSVITSENSAVWIGKASLLTQRQLEKEIVKEKPKEAVKDRMSYVESTRVKLVCGISEKLMKDLELVQDLLSQKTKRPSTLEEALCGAVDLYLKKNDPVRRAKRVLSNPKHVSRRVKSDTAAKGRHPIPARTKHEVMQRDEGQCIHVDRFGQRCEQRRWLDVHHRTPVAEGGTNTLENLITLCKNHHVHQHELRL